MSDTEQPAEAQAPVTNPAAAAVAAAWDEAVHDWYVANIQNSPLALSTPAVNHLNAVLDKLRDRLIAGLAP